MPSLTGIGEVVLLPLDVLKIKMQTNPDAIRGRGLFKLITEEGVGSLYRGWGWTMARNAPGSFAVSEASPLTSRIAERFLSSAVRRLSCYKGIPVPAIRLLLSYMVTKYAASATQQRLLMPCFADQTSFRQSPAP